MKISVVIPTLNEEKYIGKCLESIRDQKVECEIIVVDSNSSDKTVEIAKKYADRVLVNEVGIAINRQLGAEMASGDIIITTDADCIFSKNWLNNLCRHFNNKEVVCVSGPTIPIPEESNFIDRLCYWIGNQFIRFLHIFKICWFRGSNTAYRKDVFLKSGGYNPKMLAREDSELSTRLSKFGKTIFDTKAVVMTSMRRRKAMGWIKTIRYYLDTPIALITGRIYYKKI